MTFSVQKWFAPLLAIATISMASPVSASTMLFTTYSGGTLENGRMQGGTLNGIVAIDTALADYRVNPEYVLAKGFSFTSRNFAQTSIQFNNWYNGGGIAGIVAGDIPMPRLPLESLMQQQVWSGETIYTGNRNDITLPAGQRVMYGSDGQVTGYIDVTDISNRSVRFYGFNAPGFDAGGFLVETTADGRPLNFTAQADGITLSGLGFIRQTNPSGAPTLRPLTEIRMLNADNENSPTHSLEKDSLIFDDVRVGYLQMFRGSNVDPDLRYFNTALDDSNLTKPYFAGYIRSPRGYANYSQGGFYSVRLSDGAALNAVPESATWSMMLLGFGLAGASLRSRCRRSVAYA